ncbi:sigma factor-like helix-turn-helix DNA-binding protein [Megasphaera sp.]|jgi:RNA polymerase sigma factor (sigma-70 family)|uniref:sigma factor-like helix-turn-helix DNA-binding protein n=1 Tax=Megasphaera sp. TaxID=2023260 RepID=UPI002067BD7D|nr:sigma factor-like helix-turn-helix DNA-binding protein [Megasphaera sp.]DAR40942.1 MAG TPA: Sigma factor AlgU negative regulatory factor, TRANSCRIPTION.96A [Bacteriophage sp.]
MGNQKTTKVKQQYYIPLEVKEGTIITKEYEEAPRTWSKIGNRRVRTILIPATEEQYKAYMQPEWKEDKRQQRLVEKRKKREKAQAEHRDDSSVQGWDTPVSFERLCETEYGFLEKTGQAGLEEILEKEELLEALHRELAKLEELDQTILQMVINGSSEAAIGQEVGLSQKGVNKRKHRLLEQLRERLEDYR